MLLKRLSKKAFIFSLDALLALLAATVLISASFFYLSQVQTLNWSQPSLFVTSMDTLATLRLDGSLEDAVDTGSNSTIELFFNNMYPSNICGRMELYSRSGTLVLSSKKTGCSLPASTDSKSIFVSRRTFVANKQLYYAYLRTWFV